jgi:hypothetical protein
MATFDANKIATVDLSQHLLSSRDCILLELEVQLKRGLHTINAGVVGLNEGLLHLTVLNEEGVTLASLVAKDGSTVKIEIQGLGERASWVTNEAEL